jgi:hypothetical protein
MGKKFKDLREFILPYEAVRTAKEPDLVLLDFLQSTYEAAADLANWDRNALERKTFPSGPMKFQQIQFRLHLIVISKKFNDVSGLEGVDKVEETYAIESVKKKFREIMGIEELTKIRKYLIKEAAAALEEGQDEMDGALGRGWAFLNGNFLEGRFYFHLGDDSAFRAKKK